MLVQKQKNKKRKLYHFINLINDFHFYDLKSGTVTENNIEFKGTLYVLDKPDMIKLEKIINTYHNTKIITRQYKYAPELKDVCLFVAK